MSRYLKSQLDRSTEDGKWLDGCGLAGNVIPIVS